MTLILGVLTNEYVALSCDRRVSLLDKSRQEDTDVKTVVLNDQFVMGWTGIAHPERKWMSDWIADELKNVTPDEYFPALASGMDEVYRHTRGVAGYPHAFMAVGFEGGGGGRVLNPVCVYVSNSLDRHGYWATDRPVAKKFGIRMHRLGNQRQRLLDVGYPIPKKVRISAVPELRRVVKAKPLDPIGCLDLLVEVTRATAATSDGYVGRSMLLCTLPKRAVGVGGVTMGGASTSTEEVYAFNLGSGDELSVDGVHYQPAIIGPAIMVTHATVMYNENAHDVPQPFGPPPF